MAIDKEMLIGELIHVDENIPAILMRAGMHCLAVPLLRQRAWKRRAWFMESTAMPWWDRSTSIWLPDRLPQRFEAPKNGRTKQAV